MAHKTRKRGLTEISNLIANTDWSIPNLTEIPDFVFRLQLCTLMLIYVQKITRTHQFYKYTTKIVTITPHRKPTTIPINTSRVTRGFIAFFISIADTTM
jgi:hypothetical protein